ncbi:TrkH family potassium uptake protein [Lachnoclostridium sp. Marseille-P6806]|uniref:TrkH family potassium uptake protein n=1 Tax=Lachnoclostridium sp. Marseille-P6806 TaxID=2364793 RepID=UPI001031DBE4|nr:TrkH family potassium uptake protein [Lachnoclostridium sp. Marseille-P6806]
MNFKLMGRIIAYILAIEAVFMVPAEFVALYFHEYPAAKALTLTMVILLTAVGALFLATRGTSRKFHAKDGLVCVGVGWILLSAFGALPFVISGEIPNYIDALFETVSGFTTTGASILTDVEAMSHGLLYWRSFTHWVGGMGVLVFMLAIVPLSGRNSGFTLHLLRAESPGPNVGKIVPRMRETAEILYIIYIVLTVLDVVLLLAGGMPVFDAVCTAFGTAGTGGFGIRGDSIASYSPYLQGVCTVFMILFGVNFTCYYLLLRREWREVLRDEELRCYVVIILASIALITWNVHGSFDSLLSAGHHAAFTVASIITTTGFATKDFSQWPTFSKAILLFLMFVGACAGSTGGGIKVSRVLLLFKGLRRNIHQVLHPQRMQSIRVNRQNMSEQVMANTNAYLSAYVVILILSFLVISLESDFSFESNFSAVMCTFNNIGPGLDQVGPASNFHAYGVLSKLVLIGDMLLGRLEIFPILVLFSKSTWRRLK